MVKKEAKRRRRKPRLDPPPLCLRLGLCEDLWEKKSFFFCFGDLSKGSLTFLFFRSPGKKSKPDCPFYLAHITLSLVMRSVPRASLTRWEEISLRKERRITSRLVPKIGKGYLFKPRLEPTIRYELAFDPKLIFLVMCLSRGVPASPKRAIS